MSHAIPCFDLIQFHLLGEHIVHLGISTDLTAVRVVVITGAIGGAGYAHFHEHLILPLILQWFMSASSTDL